MDCHCQSISLQVFPALRGVRGTIWLQDPTDFILEYFSGGLPCMGIVSLLPTIFMAPFLSLYYMII